MAEETTVVIWVLTWRRKHSNDEGTSGEASGQEDRLKIGMHLTSSLLLSQHLPETQCMVEIHPPSFCFSLVLHLYLHSSLVFKMICGLPEEAAKGSLAHQSQPAKHIWKWFQGPPHSASTAPGFPAAWSRGGRNPTRSKVDASKGGAVGEQDSWKRNIGLEALQPFEISNGILEAAEAR